MRRLGLYFDLAFLKFSLKVSSIYLNYWVEIGTDRGRVFPNNTTHCPDQVSNSLLTAFRPTGVHNTLFLVNFYRQKGIKLLIFCSCGLHSEKKRYIKLQRNTSDERLEILRRRVVNRFMARTFYMCTQWEQNTQDTLLYLFRLAEVEYLNLPVQWKSSSDVRIL